MRNPRDPNLLLAQEIRQDDLPGRAAVEARGFPHGTVLLLVPVDEGSTSYELAFKDSSAFYIRQVVEPGRYDVSIKDGSELGRIVVYPTFENVCDKLGLTDEEVNVFTRRLTDELGIVKLDERLDKVSSRLAAIEGGKLPNEAIMHIADEVEAVLVATDRGENE